jgi:SAM-dependent MidA family methyltransferase
VNAVAPVATAALEEILAGAIRASGPMPFARFMELCLYHPGHGYYARGLGGGGGRDYVTSSGIHRAYGALLARQAAEMWRLLGAPERFRFVEFGPGEGRFARDVLDASRANAPFAAALEYVLVETSPALVERQQRLNAATGTGAAAAPPRVAWKTLEELEREADRSGGFAGCLFANEVLDAFPVHRVTSGDEGLREVHVDFENGAFRTTLRPLSTPDLGDYLRHHSIAPEPGQIADVAPAAARFVGRAARLLSRGWFVIVDYGDEAADLFHPARRRGSLRAFHRHRLVDDLLARPGEQDLTAHVDFTAVRRAAAEAGCEAAATVSQAHFLLALGALEDFEAQDLAAREALKEIVLPDRMGGAFRVLVLRRGGAPEGLRGLSAPWRNLPVAEPTS